MQTIILDYAEADRMAINDFLQYPSHVVCSLNLLRAT